MQEKHFRECPAHSKCPANDRSRYHRQIVKGPPSLSVSVSLMYIHTRVHTHTHTHTHTHIEQEN